MANTLDAHHPPMKLILMCPFCDVIFDFNKEKTWRKHAGEHFGHHSAKHTANQSTQTCDMEFSSTKVDLFIIKREILNEPANDTMKYHDFNDDIDHFISVSADSSDVKLEPTIRPTIQEQMLNTETVNCKQGALKRKRRSKPSVKFNFPTEPVNCALCSDIINGLFPTAEEITDEFKRTKQVECRLCGLSIEQIASVSLHYSRVHFDEVGKLTSMAACNACVANKGKGKKLQLNSNPSWITCELCSRLSRDQTSYQYHLRHFHKDRCVYSCTHCDRRFIGRSRYTKHVYTKHSPKYREPKRCTDKEYHCDRCGKVFNLRDRIVGHLRSHFSQQRFQCTLCPAALKSSASLVRHMIVHSGCKEVTCDVCGRRFAEKSNLQSHMASHTGEQPFACKVCGKRFSMKSNMLKHLRTHTREKPFACDQCDKRYRDSSDLRRHKRIHGGAEKTQICTLCDKRYYEAKFLRSHLKSAHNIVVANPSGNKTNI